MNTKTVWGIVAVIFIALVAWLVLTPGKPGQLDAFATCLKDRGVKFYGAFWCPHCQAQKALFGRSVDKLPYVECSNPDGQSQNALCNSLGIQGYPTWVFPALNGATSTATSSGEQTLKELADKSSCLLPQ